MFRILEEPSVGEFEITSGKVIVTDPCYEVGTWCQGTLDNVAKGKWTAFVGRSDERMWGMRCAELTVVHDSYARRYEQREQLEREEKFTKEACEKKGVKYSDIFAFKPLKWEDSKIHVGVDSGQAGVFDADIYPKGECGEYGDKESFYGQCCDTTLNWPGAGVIKGGVVSSSGYGDGGYRCMIAKDPFENAKIIAIKIIFIGDPEDGEETDEDLNDDTTNE